MSGAAVVPTSEIYAKSPTRVDLSGGTLDCWPLFLQLGEPVTVNVAIDVWTHAWLTPRSDLKVQLISDDFKVDHTFSDANDCLSSTDERFTLYRPFLKYWQPTSGFTLRTRSESPVGGGLGGSSSLCISIMKVFSAWQKKTLDPYEMVRVTANIEAQILSKPTGTQDYFPPIFGGLNFITYGLQGPRVEVQPLPVALFKKCFVLVYTGKAHHSGINNWQVIKNFIDGDQRTIMAMQSLTQISSDMQAALKKQEYTLLPGLFAREYVARTTLSDGFSSPEIRKLNDVAKGLGAHAKICGAGGGGCVMIWCPDGQTDKVRVACQQAGFEVMNSQAWQAP